MTQSYQHWQYTVDSQKIGWLALDRAGSGVNSLDREIIEELGVVLSAVSDDMPIGLVVMSAKPTGFVAGADISQFTELKTEDEAFDLVRQAQLVFDSLEALPIPTVAMIHGFALGGGYELALACRYRVVSDDRRTILGLPEVKLGLHPGFGGTVRSAKLMGAVSAMTIMLKGSPVPAKKARKLGMVDAVVPERYLKKAATDYILRQPKAHRPRGLARYSNHPLCRGFLAKQFLKSLKGKARRSHYPAPFALIDHWRQHGISKDAQVSEARSIAQLLVGDVSHHLVRAFFLQTRLKGLGKTSAEKVAHVHVIGAGTMGGDIAAWCALKGLRVTLQDQSVEKIEPAMKRAYALCQKKLRDKREVARVWDRLQPDVGGTGVKQADVVIEAIFEDLAAKQSLYQSVEPLLKPGAILASNTSSIPLEDLSTVLKDPSRFVGIHFFNPVAKMPLVEIVKSEQSADGTIDRALRFVGQIGRWPVPVRSRPGFLVNRILMPYLVEAILMWGEGVQPELIDQLATDFGMPMGPMALADQVGLDVCLAVSENLMAGRSIDLPDCIKHAVSEGHLGVKTGQGIYRYVHGRPQCSPIGAKLSESESAVLTDRLVLSMANEAVACLSESIVADADLLDAAMIFGTGFAPFRGGLYCYMSERGLLEIKERLLELAESVSPRFQPVKAWDSFLTEQGDPIETNSLPV